MSDRAQSEVVGVVAATAVVVAVTATVGLAFVESAAPSDRELTPIGEVDFERAGADLAVVHRGGDALATGRIRFVVAGDPYPAAGVDVDALADGRFEPGERLTVPGALANRSGGVRVLLVHAPTGGVVDDDRLVLPAEATPAPTPTPSPTATATATPTATPEPTPTPAPPDPPTVETFDADGDDDRIAVEVEADTALATLAVRVRDDAGEVVARLDRDDFASAGDDGDDGEYEAAVSVESGEYTVEFVGAADAAGTAAVGATDDTLDDRHVDVDDDRNWWDWWGEWWDGWWDDDEDDGWWGGGDDGNWWDWWW
ncbi:hypothetical protein [Halobaculum lipolyticum]|uniref:hypothetical protein n=1 Tax=Halobaculum lipolyticum TaxID=3032001 RepID=UPI0024C21986|nr:hypothetical protein [Halobaculum sp. DT31]